MRVIGGILGLALVANAQSPTETLKSAHRALRSGRTTDTELIAWIAPVIALPDKAAAEDQTKLRIQAARFVLALLASERDRAPREAVRWEAARALARLHPSTFRRVKAALEQGLLRDNDENSHRVWEAVCQSLLALDLDEGGDFLMEEFVDATTSEANWRRTRAALLAFCASPRPDSRRRHEYVQYLLAQFQLFPGHVEDDYDWIADQRGIRKGLRRWLAQHGEYWADLRPIVQRVLRRFTADPTTGALARDHGADFQLANLLRTKLWNARNKNRAQVPWLDPAEEPLPRTTLREFREPGEQFFLTYSAPWTRYWPAWRDERLPAREDPAGAPGRQELATKVLPPLFRTAIRDADWRVRGMAAIAMGRTGTDPKALWALLDSEKDERTREAIAYGLLLRHDSDSAKSWQTRAEDASENPQVRAIALLALGLLGDAAFVQARSYEHPELEGSRLIALGLAGAKGESNRLTALVLAQTSPPGIRGAAAAALARIGSVDDADGLLRAIGRKDEPVRRAAAAHALAGMVDPGDRKTIRRMSRFLLDPKRRFGGHRVELAFALARIGGKDATDAIRAAVRECAGDTTRAGEYGSYLLALGPSDAPMVAKQLDECAHEWDAAAAALGLALGGAGTAAPKIRERMSTAKRVYLSAAMEALGLIGDASATTTIREHVRVGPRDRVVATGAVALARIEGAKAGPELLAIWLRAMDRAEYAGLVDAFAMAGPGKSVDGLRTIARDAGPVERAFALNALARIAAPDDGIARRLRGSFFVYDAPRALTRIARFGDSFFFAETDE